MPRQHIRCRSEIQTRIRRGKLLCAAVMNHDDSTATESKEPYSHTAHSGTDSLNETNFCRRRMESVNATKKQ